MAADASQTNTDHNQNTGGYVGELEASMGGLDFSGLGASTSSATSSANVNSVFGDVNLASGKSSAGTMGSVKGFALAILALAAYAIYAWSSKGKK